MAVFIHSRKHVELIIYYYYYYYYFVLNVAGNSSRSLQAELPPRDDCH